MSILLPLVVKDSISQIIYPSCHQHLIRSATIAEHITLFCFLLVKTDGSVQPHLRPPLQRGEDEGGAHFMFQTPCTLRNAYATALAFAFTLIQSGSVHPRSLSAHFLSTRC